MRLFLAFLLAHFFFQVCSQTVTYLYPVKVNHKWGYANKRGKVVVEPKYDAIGDENLRWYGRRSESPFRLVEAEGKLGLLDEQCREVLPPKYRQIRPLSRSLFVVTEDNLLHIVNRKGEPVTASAFEEVILLDTLWGRFFKIKMNGSWGVQELEAGEILPPVYADIELASAGSATFFKIKKPANGLLWGLVNDKNREILPCQHLDIRCVNPNFFATQNSSGLWTACDSLGRSVLSGTWQDFKPLNRHFVELTHSNGKRLLFSTVLRDTLSLGFEGFNPIDDRYVSCRSGISQGLLDSTGQVVVAPAWQNIRPMNDSLFRVQRVRWGVFSLRRGLVLPCEYDSIHNFQGAFCFVKKSGLLGVMDTAFREIIPPAFDRLVMADTLMKAYDNGSLSIFHIAKDGQVALLDEFSNVQTLRIGYNTEYFTEAIPLKNRRRSRPGMAGGLEETPFTGQENGRWVWRRDPATKRWGLTDTQPGSGNGTPPIFREVLYLKTPALSLVFTNEKTTKNSADVLPAFFTVDTFYHLALFSHADGKFITPFDMLGLRGGDFESGLPISVFLAENGRFGLLTRKGQQIHLPDGEPLRFTWIGEFHEGRARFCQGGRIAVSEDGRPEKTSVDVVGNFIVQFGLNTTNPYGPLRERAIFIEEKKDEKVTWGYVDTLGRVVIEPRFDFANDFEEGLAVNQSDGLWGAIDRDGKEKLAFRYSSVAPFNDGNWLVGLKSPTRLVFNPNGHERITRLYERQGRFAENRCRVQKDGLWGYMAEDGTEVIPCQFDEARDFSEGLAAVRKDGRWSFITPEGMSAFELRMPEGEISEVGDFSEGLAWFKLGYLFGFIDPKGEVKISPEFTKVFSFKNGVARAVLKGKTGLIDTAGQWILKPARFEYVSDFNRWGVAEAREKFRGKRCLITSRGEMLTPLKYDLIGEFHEGFAKVAVGQLYGLINFRGEDVIPLKYDAVGDMSEGLVNVRPRHSMAWHFVDTLGRTAFPGEFQVVEPFRQGHAFVQTSHFNLASRHVINRQGEPVKPDEQSRFEFFEDGIFGLYTPDGEGEGRRSRHFYFADAEGRPLFDRLFEKIEPFSNGVALVRSNYRWGIINRNGLFVLPPKYPFLNRQANGEVIVNLPVLYGVVDHTGKEVFPAAFDRIELMNGDRFRLEIGEKVGYAKLNGEWVWEVQR